MANTDPAAAFPAAVLALGATVVIARSAWPVLSAITMPSPPVPYGSPYRLSGRVTVAGSGVPMPGVGVEVVLPPPGGDYFPQRHSATAVTDSAGRWSAWFDQPSYGAYVGVAARDVELTSQSRTLEWGSGAQGAGYTQHWVVSLRASTQGVTHYLDTQLVPRTSGTAQLQRRSGTSWVVVATKATTSSGSARFATQRDGCYRVRALQSWGYLAAYTSAVRCVS